VALLLDWSRMILPLQKIESSQFSGWLQLRIVRDVIAGKASPVRPPRIVLACG
jgi:hypothetical protein